VSESPASTPVTPPAVLAPVTVVDSDGSDAVIEAVAAAGAGATGIDLAIPDPQLALGAGIAIADQLADTSGLLIFLRTDVPLAPGAHTRICPPDQAPLRRGSNCVADIGIDTLGLGPDASEVAARWPEVSAVDQPFMVSTVGFDPLAEAELMALATVATARGAVAITSQHVRIVRRVVDTVTAVLTAKEGA